MTPSDRLYEFLRGWEGVGGNPVLEAYLDGAGVPTIGYGHTAGVLMGQTINADQAEQFLERDMLGPSAAMTAAIKVPVSQQQFDAVCSLAFNVGSGAIRGSTLMRKLNGAEFDAAALQFICWDRSGGVEVDGLEKRRAAETRMFVSGDYSGRP